MEKTIKVAIMPGKINEFGVETGTTIASVLALAELNPAGYDVKVDGVKVDNVDTAVVTESTNLILLVKQVKGNAEKVVKTGVMPGRISDIVVATGTSIADALALAELNPAGYDVKVDGVKVTDLDNTHVSESTNLILLVKQVKGN